MPWSWGGALQGASRGAQALVDMLQYNKQQEAEAERERIENERRARLDEMSRFIAMQQIGAQGGRVAEGTKPVPWAGLESGPTQSFDPGIIPPGSREETKYRLPVLTDELSRIEVDPSRSFANLQKVAEQKAAAEAARVERQQVFAGIRQRYPDMSDEEIEAAITAGKGGDYLKPPVPEAGMSEYQREQLRLAQERLDLQRGQGGEPSAAQRATEAQRSFSREQSLQADFANDPVIKQAKLYASAFQGIMAASKRNDAQSNLALMYEAVKMRDPNAVREGELKLQEKARSIPTFIRGLWDKASRGNVLTAGEREQIVRWAAEKITEQQRIVAPIMQRGGEAARRFGADSAYVAPDPFAGITRLPSGFEPPPSRRR